jgi:EAL domain-containing protein (putative c-di-GMP-specific phosphodiesterase class I)
MGDRLRATLREGDTVGRVGGDEFVLILADQNNEEVIFRAMQRISAKVAEPITVEGKELYVTCSAGISLYPQDGPDVDTLLKNADAAMYRAKDRGRNNYQFYTADMNAKAVERLALETHLRRALERSQLLLHYQPQVDLKTGHIIGTEALVRWQRPEAGLVSPLDFIPLAEETGLIVPIGTWILDRSCRQVQRWQAAHPELPPLTASVNLSGRQLGHPDLIGDVARVLADTGIEPGCVVLEITESVLMEDVESSRSTLDALKALGVRIVVDDFGTGYSSLAYLRRFPVDMLKIDQSFIAGLGEDPSDTAIVAAVVSLAHTLGLEAVAEGVETEEQLAELRRLDCDHAQGYLMARPLYPDDLSELLTKNPTF